MRKLVFTLFLLKITCSFVGCFYQELFTQSNAISSKNHLYVSPLGSGSNSGSKRKPLKTIQKAANLAIPGTTVFVRKGTYKEQ